MRQGDGYLQRSRPCQGLETQHREPLLTESTRDARSTLNLPSVVGLAGRLHPLLASASVIVFETRILRVELQILEGHPLHAVLLIRCRQLALLMILDRPTSRSATARSPSTWWLPTGRTSEPEQAAVLEAGTDRLDTSSASRRVATLHRFLQSQACHPNSFAWRPVLAARSSTSKARILRGVRASHARRLFGSHPGDVPSH